MMRVDSVVNRGDVALPAWMFVVLLKAAAAAAAAVCWALEALKLKPKFGCNPTKTRAIKMIDDWFSVCFGL